MSRKRNGRNSVPSTTTKGSLVPCCSGSSAISQPTVTAGIGPWCMMSWGWSKTRTSIRGEKRVQIGLSFVVGGLIPTIPVLLSLPYVQWWAYGLTAMVLGAVKARSTRQRPVWAGLEFLVVVTPSNRGWCGSGLAPAWRMSLPSRVQVALWLCRHATAIHRVPSSL